MTLEEMISRWEQMRNDVERTANSKPARVKAGPQREFPRGAGTAAAV
jgi:hypothetical protein